jgi:hypothetical protein
MIQINENLDNSLSEWPKNIKVRDKPEANGGLDEMLTYLKKMDGQSNKRVKGLERIMKPIEYHTIMKVN